LDNPYLTTPSPSNVEGAPARRKAWLRPRVLTPEEASLKERAWNSFWVFLTEVWGCEDLWEPCHRPFAEMVERIPSLKEAHVAIAAPRGLGKTTIVSQAWPIFRLWKDPDLRILLDSSKLALSTANLATIKTQCEQNERLRAVASDLLWDEPKKDAPDMGWLKDRVVFKRSKINAVGSLECGGVDAAMTGKHFHLIIADDISTEDNAESDAGREKVMSHYANYRFQRKGRLQIVSVFTHWHQDAQPARLVDPNGPYRGKVFVVGGWRSCYVDDDEEKGIIFPRQPGSDMGYTPEELNEAREEDERKFDRQYRNRFRSSVEEQYMAADFPRFEEPSERPREHEYRYYTAVDPSNTWEGKKGDFCVVMTGAVDPFGHIWVVDITRGRMASPEIVATIRNHVVKWKPRLVVVETVAAQRQIIPWLYRDQVAHDVYYPIYQAKRGRGEPNKLQRGLSMTHLAKQRGIHVLAGQNGDQLVHELVTFPGRYDDCVDALADIYAHGLKPTAKRLRDEDLATDGAVLEDHVLRELREDDGIYGLDEEDEDAVFSEPGVYL
jgi:phage terminase large subunit-like protein